MIAALLLSGAALAEGQAGLGAGWTGFGLGVAGLGGLGLTAYVVDDTSQHPRKGGLGQAFGMLMVAGGIGLPSTIVLEIAVPMTLAGGARARDPWEPGWAGAAGWACYGLHFAAWGGVLAAGEVERPPLGRVSAVALLGTEALALTFGAIQLAQSGAAPEEARAPLVIPLARGVF